MAPAHRPEVRVLLARPEVTLPRRHPRRSDSREPKISVENGVGASA
jgi:hypothetical protein